MLVILSWAPGLDTVGYWRYVEGVPAVVCGGIFTIEQGKPILLDLWGKSVLSESIGHQELHNTRSNSTEQQVTNTVLEEELILILYDEYLKENIVIIPEILHLKLPPPNHTRHHQ